MVYVAPADVHMVIRDGSFRLERTPKQNFARPAIDALFESAALAFGPRVIGVILTGKLSDGVAGLVAIHAHGGICLAQDPAEAPSPSMPLEALRYDHIDHVFRQNELAALLDGLVRVKAPTGRAIQALFNGERRVPKDNRGGDDRSSKHVCGRSPRRRLKR